ncbi:hypothetical protein SLA2020_485910 [Shorea laevis]
MKIYSLFFSLTLTILFVGIHSATLTVKNNCQNTIWPATLTGGTDAAQLSNTGFELASQASFSLDVPASWTGRIWARTQCSSDNSGRFTCATADCGSGQVTCNGMGGAPPASLAEFTLASEGRQDYYDLSLVDGFNLPVSITPQGGSGPTCTTTNCAANPHFIHICSSACCTLLLSFYSSISIIFAAKLLHFAAKLQLHSLSISSLIAAMKWQFHFIISAGLIATFFAIIPTNAVCPSELALTGSDESIIGCKSACVVFNQPQCCCTGQYNSADTCKPTNYSMIFKNQCPQAYSYAYDDRSSTFSCTGGPNYLITFCP